MRIRTLMAPLYCGALLSLPAGAAEEPTSWEVDQPAYSAESRNVSIDVSEGTWMSLDVSPDGEHIVFDLLGDIYRIPFGGGEAEALTSGHAWDMQPRYAPDGRRIAFTSDRAGGDNIWTLELDSGQFHQVSHERFRLLNNPTWSPDGEFIAARKHFTTTRSLGTGEIWLYHASGGEDQAGQQVIERPSETFQKELGEPAFAADGSAIYFTQNSSPGDTFTYHQDTNKEIFQIRKVELADGKVTTVAGGPGGAVRPTPSPDGRYLAYVKRVRAASRLFVMELASGEETMLHDSLDQDMQETWAVHGVYPNMDWTPDSRQLVFWNEGRLWRIAREGGEPVEIPFSVKDSRTIYPAPRFPVAVAPPQFETRMPRFAQRSPDGESVLFESLGRLYVKHGASAPRAITQPGEDGIDYSPVWAPDGRTVYFLRWHDSELSRLYRVSAKGGRATRLELEKGQYSELAIDQDGRYLALRKRAGSPLLHPDWDVQPGIYLVDLRSGKQRFVSEKGRHPHFGPDDRLYLQDRSGAADGRGSDTASTVLVSVNHHGEDRREIARVEHARHIRLAPDGRHIAFIDGYQVHLTRALFSGKPLQLDAATPPFPTRQVSETGGTFLSWGADGRTLSWSTGASFRSVAVDDPDAGIQRTDLSLKVDTAAPATRLALRNARIITMDAERQVIDGGTVLVDGNRIEAILEGDSSVPEGYTAVDLEGKTVVPGLIDIHAHGPYGSDDIIPQQNWNLLAHLALGVTTVHNPSSNAETVFPAAEYQRAGKILGPRIYSTGEIVYGARSRWFAPVDGLDDALAHVRRLKAQGAISIKNYNQPRREQRQQVIEASRQEGLMVVAEGGSLYHLDLSFVADGITGIEHNVPTLEMYDDVTQLWQATAVGYTPTQVVSYGGLTAEDYYYQQSEVWKHPILANFVPPSVLQPRAVRRPMAPEADYRDDDAAAAAKVLLDAGVLVNTGGHGQREGLATHWEMWSFARGGFSPMEALAAATINPAKYMGLDADLGSIEAGKLADLVILEDDPLADISATDKIRYVMLNGRLYQAGDLAEVHSGEATLEPFYWQLKPEGSIR